MEPLLAHGFGGHGAGWAYVLLVAGMGVMWWWPRRRRRGEDPPPEADAEGRHDGA